MRRQLEMKLLLGPAYQDHGSVFGSFVGTGIVPANLGRGFDKLLAALAVHMRFHDLRHAHARLLLARMRGAAINPKVVSERLGPAPGTRWAMSQVSSLTVCASPLLTAPIVHGRMRKGHEKRPSGVSAIQVSIHVMGIERSPGHAVRRFESRGTPKAGSQPPSPTRTCRRASA